MNFSTPIKIASFAYPIDYSSHTFFIGSCFAENISKKFDYYKLKNTSNPFGVLFHSLAVEKIIQKAVQDIVFTADDLVVSNELWCCLDAHSELSATNKDELLAQLNQRLRQTQLALQQATHISITLGTSWVYKYLPTNQMVANCHKIPQKEFSKELLSVEVIAESLNNIIRLLPNKHILFTISPVRHSKDGFFENNLSKAHLFAALNHVLGDQAHYFPAYEIIMDELRDYRFFAADMLHPNQLAIDYIWERFSENYLSAKALDTSKEIAAIQKALQHKAFNPDTLQHQQFVANTQKRIEALGELWY
ncbi:MAG TPA: GSCFA domain-containing protein [Flavobacterium sp.]|nr:GSCFA domain-containing protein [Flavobacterium sp.]